MSLVSKVFDAGVVGAGGAGFPAHVKLAGKVRILIANGVECEPLLYSDKVAMLKYADDIISGIALVMEETKASEAVIAVKSYAKDQIRRFEAVIAKTSLPLSVFTVGDFYPSGDEHILVNLVTSKIIAEKGIPLSEGVLVNNVNTLRNIYLASKGQPVTDVICTLNGKISEAGVYSIPIGMPVRSLLEETGNRPLKGCSVIEGGPLTGRLIVDLEEPVSKTTGGILVLPDTNPVVASRKASTLRSFNTGVVCNQCGRCTEYCPRYLLGHEIFPNRAMLYKNYGVNGEEVYKSALLCVNCALCEVFACQMGLSPKRVLLDMASKIPPEERGKFRFAKPDRTSIFKEARAVPTSRLVAKLRLLEYRKSLEFKGKIFKPRRVVLKLRQGFGYPSIPSVKAGDAVKRGDLVARAHEKIGSNLHSSIDGRVTEVGNSNIVVEAL